MRHTFYGDAPGRFVGSGTRLFLKGGTLWLVVMGPLLLGLGYAIRGVDWNALADAIGSDNVIGQIESASPNFGPALASLVAALLWSTLAAAVFYPAFQAMTLRWWASGLRFGTMAAKSRLRARQMYRLYFRFVGYALVFALIAGVISTFVFGFAFAVLKAVDNATIVELTQVIGGIISYVVLMLGYSTIYQVTVKLRLWRLSFETVELTGLQELERVRAAGVASSGFGEGLADALDVGGL